jgi:hypothetical protein
MRLRHRDGQTIHLGYCTNVHPGEDLREIIAQLDTYAVAVRRLVSATGLASGSGWPHRSPRNSPPTPAR